MWFAEISDCPHPLHSPNPVRSEWAPVRQLRWTWRKLAVLCGLSHEKAVPLSQRVHLGRTASTYSLASVRRPADFRHWGLAVARATTVIGGSLAVSFCGRCRLASRCDFACRPLRTGGGKHTPRCGRRQHVSPLTHPEPPSAGPQSRGSKPFGVGDRSTRGSEGAARTSRTTRRPRSVTAKGPCCAPASAKVITSPTFRRSACSRRSTPSIRRRRRRR